VHDPGKRTAAPITTPGPVTQPARPALTENRWPHPPAALARGPAGQETPNTLPKHAPGIEPGQSRARSPNGQALDGLAGDLGDDLEVLVDVQDGQPGQLRGRGDDQVGH
jgi:hypothetical protein